MSLSVSPPSGKRRKLFYYTGALCLLVLVIAGVFADNGWFPSGHSRGWFGRPLAKNASSAWNPFATDPNALAT